MSPSDSDVATHSAWAPEIVPGEAYTVTVFVTIQLPPRLYVITDVPAIMPSTTPDVPTVATAVVPLVHVPEVVASNRVTESPVHTLPGPVISAGALLTVTVVVAIHPVGSLNVICAVPAAMPDTTPVAEPTVAMPVALLLHVPAPLASASVVDDSAQTLVVPVIAAGSGFTATVAVT
jgi:hypothetical protein